MKTNRTLAEGAFFLLDCVVEQYSIIIEQTMEKCGYQCIGNYQCGPGEIRINPNQIMCLKDGNWNLTEDSCTFGKTVYNINFDKVLDLLPLILLGIKTQR